MSLNTVVFWLLVVGWSLTIIFVTWDTQRRGLVEPYRLLWRLLPLIPLLGFVAYLVARSFLPAKQKAQPVPRRVTFLKPEAPAKRLPTIPAAEYLRAAQPVRAAAGPEGGQAAYSLIVSAGPHAGAKFAIEQWPACIGRGPGCEIRLDDDRGVSRRHAELYRQAGQVHLRDLGSSHGSTVNGSIVADKRLASGDEIRLGHSILIFKADRRKR